MRLRNARTSGVMLAAVLLAGGIVALQSRHAKEPDGGASEASATVSTSLASAPSTVGPRTPEAIACQRGMLALLSDAAVPMSVELFSSKSSALAPARQQVTKLFETLAMEARGKFSWSEIQVDSAENEQRARALGLEPVAVPGAVAGHPDVAVPPGIAPPTAPVPTAGTGSGVHPESAFLGAVLVAGNERGTVPVPLPRSEHFEFFFAQKLREVLARVGKKVTPVGLLSGYDELRLDEPRMLVGSNSPSLEGLLENSFPFYELRTVPIDGGLDALRDLPALFVTQPGRDLSEDQLELLDDFLMLGNKTLVVMASAVSVKAGDDHFHGRLDAHGLERLLSPYGIDLVNDLVRDSAEALALPALPGATGGELRIDHVPIVSSLGPPPARLDAGFAGFFQIERLAFPYASTLELHPERQPGATLKPLARTSGAAVSSEQAAHLDPLHAAREATADGKERVLAALVEGELRSAFAKKSAAGRLLVIASSHFGANPFARALPPAANLPVDAALARTPVGLLADGYARKHLTSTILVFKNLLDWATGDETLLACSALIRPGQANTSSSR